MKDYMNAPNLYKMVCDVINSCDLCKRYKDSHTKKQPYGSIQGTYPFDIVSLDITGPLRLTSCGNSYILGIVDNFSKMSVICALRNVTCKTILDALKREWIPYFGYPQHLHTDRGTQFIHSEFQHFCTSNNIIHTSSPAYAHFSNGIVERLFKTIKPLIAIKSEEENVSWDKVLKNVQTAINITKSNNTKQTPIESMAINTFYSDKCNFTINEMVYCKSFRQTKDGPKYEGPYKIVEHKGNRVFALLKKAILFIAVDVT